MSKIRSDIASPIALFIEFSLAMTVNCASCGMAKAKRRIRRESREFKEEPGVQLALGFHH